MAPSLCAPAISARGDNEQRERVYALLPRQLKLERRFFCKTPRLCKFPFSPCLTPQPASQPHAHARTHAHLLSSSPAQTNMNLLFPLPSHSEDNAGADLQAAHVSAQPCPCTPSPATPPSPHPPPSSAPSPLPKSAPLPPPPKKKKKIGHLPFFINNGQRPLHPHTPSDPLWCTPRCMYCNGPAALVPLRRS